MMIDPVSLRSLLVYDAGTGYFYRAGRYPAKPVGRINADGYVTIKLKGRAYLAHRLAWAYIFNEWPRNVIDHINRDRADNRLCNLRDVTSSVNNLNRTLITDTKNVSGYKGVTLVRRKNGPAKYQAVISRSGDCVYLGVFDTAEAAAEAYAAASIKRNIR